MPLAAARLDGFKLADQGVLIGTGQHGADDKNTPLGLLPGFVEIGIQALRHG